MFLSAACRSDDSSLRDAVDQLGTCLEQLQQESDPWAWSLPILVTILVAGIAFAGAVVGVMVQRRISRADQLWKRLELAYGAALSEDENRKMLGLLALERLSDPRLAKRDGYVVAESDVRLMNEISDLVLISAQEGDGS
ncbi:hypothetical protein [Agromyces aerolatus]|uniref:hypothetical protein n=1 Tax=Agromyces sp. LY-1074 TaxID=3074080 RepID=UPI002866D1B4|nr:MULTISPECIES: hypothetical protein [unclassified Agromyces]MDR5700963.1 hypothetical protein [Agromyces sp. LY-1074]MDR5707376.1 hypothetical protein [Agromyces sp. LY-1358]